MNFLSDVDEVQISTFRQFILHLTWPEVNQIKLNYFLFVSFSFFTRLIFFLGFRFVQWMCSFVLLINIPTLLWQTLQPYRQWHFLLCVWGRKCLCPRWAVYYFGRQHLVQHQHQHEMAVHLDPMHEHVADIVRAKQFSYSCFVLLLQHSISILKFTKYVFNLMERVCTKMSTCPGK